MNFPNLKTLTLVFDTRPWSFEQEEIAEVIMDIEAEHTDLEKIMIWYPKRLVAGSESRRRRVIFEDEALNAAEVEEMTTQSRLMEVGDVAKSTLGSYPLVTPSLRERYRYLPKNMVS